MAHQYSQVDFDSSVEVNEDNLGLYFGGVESAIDHRSVLRPPTNCPGGALKYESDVEVPTGERK